MDRAHTYRPFARDITGGASELGLELNDVFSLSSCVLFHLRFRLYNLSFTGL